AHGRRQVEERLCAVDVSGDSEKQDQLLHGLPADLPALHRGGLQFRAHLRRHDCLTRSASEGRKPPELDNSSLLDIARHVPTAARSQRTAGALLLVGGNSEEYIRS